MDYIVSIPALARENVRISYETISTFDPKAGNLQAKIHSKHIEPVTSKPQVVEAPAIKCPIPTANQPVLRPWFKPPLTPAPSALG
jgi:hypothetical protein